VTRAGWLAAATAQLAQAAIPDPAREARLLLRHATGQGAAGLSVAMADPLAQAEADWLARALTRRCAREPLSHITGTRAFWEHAFAVTPAVLDPRPETEILVGWALEGPPPARIIDLGTGSGCILLSLLAAWPQATGLGVDASAAALAVARRNADALGLADRAAFVPGDWLEGETGSADLVVANPPYLATAELDGLAPELRHEPRAALDGGPDGLEPYRRIAVRLPSVLRAGGAALFEIGPTQADAVSAILAAAGLPGAVLRRDLDGRPRTLRVQRQ
jgi:release factor glutamine methyltransferase